MDAIIKLRDSRVPYTIGGMPGALAADELRMIYAYWSATNFLSFGQICLYDNSLLNISEDKSGMKRLFTQCPPPGGVSRGPDTRGGKQATRLATPSMPRL